MDVEFYGRTAAYLLAANADYLRHVDPGQVYIESFDSLFSNQPVSRKNFTFSILRFFVETSNSLVSYL